MSFKMAILIGPVWILGSLMFQSLIAAQEMTVRLLQERVVQYEPLFIEVTCKIPGKAKEPSFEILIDGKPIEDACAGSLESRPISESAATDAVKTYTWLAYLHLTYKGCVFEKAGSYTLLVRELRNKISSKETPVRIDPCSQADQLVGEALVALHGIKTDRPLADRIAGLKTTVSNHAASTITRYALYELFELDRMALPIAQKDTAEENEKVRSANADLISRYGQAAKLLPHPSEWHGSMNWRLAVSKAVCGDMETARLDLIKLKETYGKHPVLGPSLNRSLESVEKSLQANTK